MRADTLALLKELNSPVYRWPGGNFVSGYDWRDGVGDRDRRPPRKNPAWTGVEHNDFGLHEFMAFCRLVDTEPLVVVNTGLGRCDERRGRSCSTRTRRPIRRWANERAAARPRRTFPGEVVGRRQRNVRQLAARPHAAGAVHREAQRVRRRHAGG